MCSSSTAIKQKNVTKGVEKELLSDIFYWKQEIAGYKIATGGVLRNSIHLRLNHQVGYQSIWFGGSSTRFTQLWAELQIP